MRWGSGWLVPCRFCHGGGGFLSPCLEILSSLALGRSTLPFATQGSHIDVPPGMYARLLGLHILGMTSLPVLGSMMWPHLHGVAQKVSFLISALLGATGSLSEVRAHFLDSWVFEDGCEAHEGDSNAVFIAGLTGGFAFQAAAFYPGPLSFALAGSSVALLLFRAAVKPWKESKKAYGMPLNAVASTVVCVAFVAKLQSAWPLLFFVQSVNIIRATKRILETKNQDLHYFTILYGWFSYIFPFALSLHPATRAASLWTVLGACAASILAADIVERKIIASGYQYCTSQFTC